jgi:hypothetical protein
VAGFLTGFSPWFFYNISRASGDVNIRGHNLVQLFVSKRLDRILSSLYNIVFHRLRKSFLLDGSNPLWDYPKNWAYWWNTHLLNLFYVVFLISFIFLVIRNLKQLSALTLGLIPLKKCKIIPTEAYKESFIILYIIIYLCVCAMWSEELLPLIPNYFLALYPFIFMTVAIFLDRLKQFSSG